MGFNFFYLPCIQKSSDIICFHPLWVHPEIIYLYFVSLMEEIMDLMPHASLFSRRLFLIKKLGIYSWTFLRLLSFSWVGNAFSSYQTNSTKKKKCWKWKWNEVTKDILGVDYLNCIFKILFLDNSVHKTVVIFAESTF